MSEPINDGGLAFQRTGYYNVTSEWGMTLRRARQHFANLNRAVA